MQNLEDTQSRNRPRQDNQSKVEDQCHEERAKVVGESLDVNEKDVRDRPQQDNQSKAAEQCHEGSAKVVGESFHVNENDVRNQDQCGTEGAKGGARADAENKN